VRLVSLKGCRSAGAHTWLRGRMRVSSCIHNVRLQLTFPSFIYLMHACLLNTPRRFFGWVTCRTA
jgi:hypothetical protein